MGWQCATAIVDLKNILVLFVRVRAVDNERRAACEPERTCSDSDTHANSRLCGHLHVLYDTLWNAEWCSVANVGATVLGMPQ